MSRSESNFDRAAFARLAESEPGHFWFEERNRLIGWALRRYFPAAGSFCEVGCGTGFVLQAIAAEFPGLALIGVDIFPEGLVFARRRVARARLLCSDLFALSLDEAVDVVGAFDIFIGVNAIDYSGYPDCRPAFIEAFERLANLATAAGIEGRGRFSIHAPLIRMTKADIIRRGLSLGVPYELTHSCYDPALDGLACGHCDSCRLRLAGFAAAGTKDPVRYVTHK